MTEATYPAKQLIANLGEGARMMIVLLDGLLEVENSKGEVIGLLQPESRFGENCLVQPSVQNRRVTTVTKVFLLLLLREDVLKVAECLSEVMSVLNSNFVRLSLTESSDLFRDSNSEGEGG